MEAKAVEFRHVDDYVDDHNTPPVLRWFLFINRLPATLRICAEEMGLRPSLYADFRSRDPGNELHRCRVVMASRLGDVGINFNFHPDYYEKRVPVEWLSNFSDKGPAKKETYSVANLQVRRYDSPEGLKVRYHELKCWPGPYSEIVSGDKKYEIRKADRDFQVADFILLRCWDPDKEEYTGGYTTLFIEHITQGGRWGLPQDVCILGVRATSMKINPTCLGCGRAITSAGCDCCAYKGMIER
jgi:hypothetical protein